MQDAISAYKAFDERQTGLAQGRTRARLNLFQNESCTLARRAFTVAGRFYGVAWVLSPVFKANCVCEPGFTALKVFQTEGIGGNYGRYDD